ncbi:IS110 family RNA-guided transposase [Vibrio rumoiensis]|uniref:IS110 family transposase n=1 Tax=Vibrio rumoiensis TaxID=76258 RepID=A0ABW7IX77_9VIBR|nr:IS110 family transposase [Vibrio rumoiensis]
MKITTAGLDIAKNKFHFYGVNQVGKKVKKRVLTRSEVLPFFSTLEPTLVVIESCGSASHWGRKLKELGHEVKLIAPQYVVPYRRKNKNDFNDAEAIAEAAQRSNMTFVPIKTIEQQDVQMLLRVRDRHIQSRTQLSNQIRGLLAEYGLIISSVGRAALRKELPEFLEDAENDLTSTSRALFSELYEELIQLESVIKEYDKKVEGMVKLNDICLRAQTVVGIGPITAAALYAAIGNGHNFSNGRHFSAWCGLVPKQHSTGGKSVLLGITKRGNPYLRTLLNHGARTVLKYCEMKDDKLSLWAQRLKKEKHYNQASIAVANKLARIVWAVISKNESYQVDYV